MSKFKKFLTVASFLIFSFSLAENITKNHLANSPYIASTATVNGIVLFKKQNSSFWEKVNLNTKFLPLDEIKTTSQSYVEVLHKNGHIIQIEPSSNFVFAGQDKDTKKWKNFKITLGKVWVKVIKGSIENDQFAIETPYASISVKGTLFAIVAPIGNICAYEGAVTVAKGSISQLVKCGFETQVNSLGFLEKIQPLSPENVDAFSSFVSKTTLGSDALQPIQQELNKMINAAGGTTSSTTGAAAGTKAQIAGTASAVTGLAAVAAIGSGVIAAATPEKNPTEETKINQTITKDPILLPTKNIEIVETTSNIKQKEKPATLLQNVSDKIIRHDSFFFKNPSLLMNLKKQKTSSLYLRVTVTDGLSKFTDTTSADSYRYNINTFNDPRSFNAGKHGVIQRIGEFGFTNLSQGFCTGLYLNSNVNAKFLNVNAKVLQETSLVLVTGFGFPFLFNTQAGVLAKGVINNHAKSDITYNTLNSRRNSGNYEKGLEELLPTGDQKNNNAIMAFSINTGLSQQITEWCTIGIGMENLFVSDKINLDTGDSFSSSLEQITHLNAIFHNDKILLNLEQALSSNDNFNTSTIELEYRFVNIPWLGQIKVETTAEYNKDYINNSYSASFKLWFMQLIAQQKIEKPGTDTTFKEEKYTTLTVKVNF